MLPGPPSSLPLLLLLLTQHPSVAASLPRLPISSFLGFWKLVLLLLLTLSVCHGACVKRERERGRERESV
jgi:hypothetical protein